MNKILLIDGNNFYTRGHFIAKSQDKDPMYFVLNMIISLKERYSSSRFIFSFDTSKSKKRLELFPEYKGNRKSTLSEEEYKNFKSNLSEFMEIMKECGLTILEGGGFEADDYIACISQMLKLRNDVLIVSTDGDLMQLVDRYIKVYEPIKGIVVTHENFEKIFEIPINLYVDYKIILGDDSDNINGVDNVGKVRAKKLILQYGNCDKIYNSLKEKSKLNKSEEAFLLAKEQGILERNRKLMDLKLYIYDDELQQRIRTQVSETKKLDENILSKHLAILNVSELFKQLKTLCLKS